MKHLEEYVESILLFPVYSVVLGSFVNALNTDVFSYDWLPLNLQHVRYPARVVYQ